MNSILIIYKYRGEEDQPWHETQEVVRFESLMRTWADTVDDFLKENIKLDIVIINIIKLD